MRAQAADKLFGALKTEANVQGITFSDAKFAEMRGLTNSTFFKALSRVSSSPTPVEGKTVMKLEQCIASYRANLPALKTDLDTAKAAKALVC